MSRGLELLFLPLPLTQRGEALAVELANGQ